MPWHPTFKGGVEERPSLAPQGLPHTLFSSHSSPCPRSSSLPVSALLGLLCTSISSSFSIHVSHLHPQHTASSWLYANLHKLTTGMIHLMQVGLLWNHSTRNFRSPNCLHSGEGRECRLWVVIFVVAILVIVSSLQC